MNVAIIGSRSFTDYERAEEFLSVLDLDITRIISGGAKGADAIAERYASEHGIPITVYPADWKRYGRGAGMIRNKLIIADADVVIAFWDGASKGTKNSIELAHKAGKQVAICYI